MSVTRTAGVFAAIGLPIAASVMFAGVASADPPHPFGGAGRHYRVSESGVAGLVDRAHRPVRARIQSAHRQG